MCGIFGAVNFDDFKELYDLNKQRGNYSWGFAWMNNRIVFSSKGAGSRDSIEDLPMIQQADWIIGHTRAPTNNSRGTYIKEENQPFNINDHKFAHNGILSENFYNELFAQFKTVRNKDAYIINDSYYLGKYLTSTHRFQTRKLAHVDGMYACWIIDERKQVKLFRNDPTIYYNTDRNMFSSVEFEDSELLPAGRVFIFPGFDEHTSFEYKSHYEVIE